MQREGRGTSSTSRGSLLAHQHPVTTHRKQLNWNQKTPLKQELVGICAVEEDDKCMMRGRGQGVTIHTSVD